MEPIDWLEQHVTGFQDLPGEDRHAILCFALLWSLFEAKALNARASAQALLALVHEKAADGQLDAQDFIDCLAYFRARYFTDGRLTAHFDGLNLRRNDKPELVRQVLNGTNNDPADSVAATLIIVYRLRNNLFHGIKWAYGIQGQRQNFEQANNALMSAITQLAPAA